MSGRRYSVQVTTAHPGDQATPCVDLARRDLTLDLARVFCVLLVVLVHLLFVGVGPDGAGGIAIARPLEEQPWFAAATWAGQIMPLFFVVGGFATLTALRSRRRRYADATAAARAFAQERVLRLARPAVALFAVLATALLGATALGIDAGLLDAVAVGIGSPLWFLCAYLICQLLAPALVALHERAPRSTLVALVAGAIAVDVVQFGTGIELLGYLNLLFVWPLVQQFGFWYADGWFARRRWWQLLAIAAVCWASLVPLTVWGPYSDDMLTNLNPPTLPLVALGLGQAAVLQLLKRPLDALMRTRAARGVVVTIGSRLMTVYLWHLPIIVALGGLGLLVPGAAPAPGGAVWWATRPLVYLLVLGIVLALSLLLGRLEATRPIGRPAALPALAAAAVLTIVPTFLITAEGLDAPLAVAAALGFGIALALMSAGQNPKSPPNSPPPNSIASKPPAASTEPAASAESVAPASPESAVS
ncbi:acyltransferase [Protaetiibacter larvae]|uniref:Acyltransferase n=1 Tax=Protaetiibacter larvae TaxID=2592654 RepID=A0A5C1Y958_9MICO|nr:acyltransferase [Protaetiibacter larvae]